MKVSFTVPGKPVPRRSGKSVHHATPRENAHASAWKWAALGAGANKIGLKHTYRLSVVAVYPARKQTPHPDTVARADLSNIIKLGEDALEGIVWGNDHRIVQYGPCCKRRATEGEEPQTIVTIEALEAPDAP